MHDDAPHEGPVGVKNRGTTGAGGTSNTDVDVRRVKPTVLSSDDSVVGANIAYGGGSMTRGQMLNFAVKGVGLAAAAGVVLAGGNGAAFATEVRSGGRGS